MHGVGMVWCGGCSTAGGDSGEVGRRGNLPADLDRLARELTKDNLGLAQEIAAVSGRTFFAYWEDLLYVGFVQPSKNLVIVLSCGRSICSSDALYELARKVSTRSSN